MKKVLAAVSVVCVIFAAGTALAARPNENGRPPMPPRMERRMPPGMEPPMPPRPEHPFMPAGREPRNVPPCPMFGDRHHTFTPDMPAEIRAKAAELAKLRVDLEEAMTSCPLNKEKALEVHAET